MNLGELPGQQEGSFKEIVAAALHAEQAWQLGHGDGQAGAGLEAHQDAVADQLHERAQTQQPGEETKHGDSKSCEAGDLRVALCITLRHRSHGTGDHERNCGSRPDRKLARGAEQGVAQAAEQIAIDAHLRRQPCEPRIGKRNRNSVGGQGYPGNDIAGQPGGTVLRQPAGRWKPPEPGCLFLVFRRIRHALPQAAAPSCSASGCLIHVNAFGLFDPDRRSQSSSEISGKMPKNSS